MSNELDLNEQLEYEKGYHWRDIAISVLVFGVFEVLSLLCQGKLFKFSFCSSIFAGTFSALWAVFIGYMVGVYFFTKKKMATFRRIKYNYPVRLEDGRMFAGIAAGGFLGGFLQGIIGVGSGNTMVAAMLFLGIDAKVTSATSGYQIVFIGLSSTIEALANNELTWLEVGWFFSICFILGGILTFFMYKLLQKSEKGPKIILIIILALCVICIAGVAPSIYFTSKNYGWPFMLDIQKSFCSI